MIACFIAAITSTRRLWPEAMAIPALDLARMLVDMTVPRPR